MKTAPQRACLCSSSSSTSRPCSCSSHSQKSISSNSNSKTPSNKNSNRSTSPHSQSLSQYVVFSRANSRRKFLKRSEPITILLAMEFSDKVIYQDNILRCNNLEINSLGCLPSKISSSIRHLYLSNNSLQNLKNITQFSSLESLSLNQNQLKYYEDIFIIKNLLKLKKINLMNNSVCYLPYFRDYIYTLKPEIILYDSVSSSSSTSPPNGSSSYTCPNVVEAKLRYKKLRGLMADCIKNKLRNLLLHHLISLRRCHVEMNKSVFGRLNFLRSAHIGDLSSPTSIFTSLSLLKTVEILRNGGVFSILHSLSEFHFSKLIQNNLLRLKSLSSSVSSSSKGLNSKQKVILSTQYPSFNTQDEDEAIFYSLLTQYQLEWVENIEKNLHYNLFCDCLLNRHSDKNKDEDVTRGFGYEYSNVEEDTLKSHLLSCFVLQSPLFCDFLLPAVSDSNKSLYLNISTPVIESPENRVYMKNHSGALLNKENQVNLSDKTIFEAEGQANITNKLKTLRKSSNTSKIENSKNDSHNYQLIDDDLLPPPPPPFDPPPYSPLELSPVVSKEGVITHIPSLPQYKSNQLISDAYSQLLAKNLHVKPNSSSSSSLKTTNRSIPQTKSVKFKSPIVDIKHIETDELPKEVDIGTDLESLLLGRSKSESQIEKQSQSGFDPNSKKAKGYANDLTAIYFSEEQILKEYYKIIHEDSYENEEDDRDLQDGVSLYENEDDLNSRYYYGIKQDLNNIEKILAGSSPLDLKNSSFELQEFLNKTNQFFNISASSPSFDSNSSTFSNSNLILSTLDTETKEVLESHFNGLFISLNDKNLFQEYQDEKQEILNPLDEKINDTQVFTSLPLLKNFIQYLSKELTRIHNDQYKSFNLNNKMNKFFNLNYKKFFSFYHVMIGFLLFEVKKKGHEYDFGEDEDLKKSNLLFTFPTLFELTSCSDEELARHLKGKSKLLRLYCEHLLENKQLKDFLSSNNKTVLMKLTKIILLIKYYKNFNKKVFSNISLLKNEELKNKNEANNLKNSIKKINILKESINDIKLNDKKFKLFFNQERFFTLKKVNRINLSKINNERAMSSSADLNSKLEEEKDFESSATSYSYLSSSITKQLIGSLSPNKPSIYSRSPYLFKEKVILQRLFKSWAIYSKNNLKIRILVNHKIDKLKFKIKKKIFLSWIMYIIIEKKKNYLTKKVNKKIVKKYFRLFLKIYQNLLKSIHFFNYYHKRKVIRQLKKRLEIRHNKNLKLFSNNFNNNSKLTSFFMKTNKNLSLTSSFTSSKQTLLKYTKDDFLLLKLSFFMIKKSNHKQQVIELKLLSLNLLNPIILKSKFSIWYRFFQYKYKLSFSNYTVVYQKNTLINISRYFSLWYKFFKFKNFLYKKLLVKFYSKKFFSNIKKYYLNHQMNYFKFYNRLFLNFGQYNDLPSLMPGKTSSFIKDHFFSSSFLINYLIKEFIFENRMYNKNYSDYFFFINQYIHFYNLLKNKKFTVENYKKFQEINKEILQKSEKRNFLLYPNESTPTTSFISPCSDTNSLTEFVAKVSSLSSSSFTYSYFSSNSSPFSSISSPTSYIFSTTFAFKMLKKKLFSISYLFSYFLYLKKLKSQLKNAFFHLINRKNNQKIIKKKFFLINYFKKKKFFTIFIQNLREKKSIKKNLIKFHRITVNNNHFFILKKIFTVWVKKYLNLNFSILNNLKEIENEGNSKNNSSSMIDLISNAVKNNKVSNDFISKKLSLYHDIIIENEIKVSITDLNNSINDDLDLNQIDKSSFTTTKAILNRQELRHNEEKKENLIILSKFYSYWLNYSKKNKKLTKNYNLITSKKSFCCLIYCFKIMKNSYLKNLFQESKKISQNILYYQQKNNEKEEIFEVYTSKDPKTYLLKDKEDDDSESREFDDMIINNTKFNEENNQLLAEINEHKLLVNGSINTIGHLEDQINEQYIELNNLNHINSIEKHSIEELKREILEIQQEIKKMNSSSISSQSISLPRLQDNDEEKENNILRNKEIQFYYQKIEKEINEKDHSIEYFESILNNIEFQFNPRDEAKHEELKDEINNLREQYHEKNLVIQKILDKISKKEVLVNKLDIKFNDNQEKINNLISSRQNLEESLVYYTNLFKVISENIIKSFNENKTQIDYLIKEKGLYENFIQYCSQEEGKCREIIDQLDGPSLTSVIANSSGDVSTLFTDGTINLQDRMKPSPLLISLKNNHQPLYPSSVNDGFNSLLHNNTSLSIIPSLNTSNHLSSTLLDHSLLMNNSELSEFAVQLLTKNHEASDAVKIEASSFSESSPVTFSAPSFSSSKSTSKNIKAKESSTPSRLLATTKASQTRKREKFTSISHSNSPNIATTTTAIKKIKSQKKIQGNLAILTPPVASTPSPNLSPSIPTLFDDEDIHLTQQIDQISSRLKERFSSYQNI